MSEAMDDPLPLSGNVLILLTQSSQFSEFTHRPACTHTHTRTHRHPRTQTHTARTHTHAHTDTHAQTHTHTKKYCSDNDLLGMLQLCILQQQIVTSEYVCMCVCVYLGLMKNLYWMRMVMTKKTTPSTAIANRFLPTMSHSRGERNLFSPETHHTTLSSQSAASNTAGTYQNKSVIQRHVCKPETTHKAKHDVSLKSDQSEPEVRLRAANKKTSCI